ncbi:histidine phosphatase family protein [Abyssisolibacter fermentans]|uniref:histidine phosphatase family protein n=1 Tax=Abyssisolibacter fermentans TaxID=1766203 RepID=UPI00083126EF|nr:histidine phosphatase family protein [Abyssisolibacter fermentans]
MKIVFVRHGEPDYNDVKQRGFIGHGRDLAHLTKLGKAQARIAAENPILDGIELVVSSPYTRALQTAAIISKYRNVEIEVELDLHEWLPDLTYSFSDYDSVDKALKLCISSKGICPKDSPIKYEELSNVFDRAKKCLEKYTSYKKIAVVTHGMLICQFAFSKEFQYCGVSEIEFGKNSKWCGWIDTL